MNPLKKSIALLTRGARGNGGQSVFPTDAFDAQCRLIRDTQRSEVTILDVGANRGQSFKSYRARFPRARIFCFEPFPDSIDELRQQMAGDARGQVVDKAVGEKEGKATFYVNAFDPTNSLLPRPSTERRYYPKDAGLKKTIEVEVIDLDTFARQEDLAHIDILKLDIQGGELKALRGAEGLLRSASISLIYSEIMFVAHYEGAPLFHEICGFLAGHGYSLFDVYDLYRATNGQIRYGDALFVSAPMRHEVVDRYPDEP